MNKPVISPLIIGIPELNRIKDFAMKHFHDEQFLPHDLKVIQAFLLIRGLEDFLHSKGYEVNFHVKSVQEVSDVHTPLDDL